MSNRSKLDDLLAGIEKADLKAREITSPEPVKPDPILVNVLEEIRAKAEKELPKEVGLLASLRSFIM